MLRVENTHPIPLITLTSPDSISKDLSLSLPLPWHERAITWLSEREKKIEAILPNFFFQDKIDNLGRYVEKQFAPLHTFNAWLMNNGQGAWYKQLATFLVKLPLRVARNFVCLIYDIIRTTLQTLTHPVQAVVKLAKLLVSLAYQLTLPETWSKIGAGIIGANLGQALVTGNPFSVIGMGVGGAMLLAGLSFGTFKAAIQAEKEHRWQEVKGALVRQVKQLPESMLTGFCMGLMLGVIQMEIEKYGKRIYNETVSSEVNKQLKNYHLPASSDIQLSPARDVIIKWPVEEASNNTALFALKLSNLAEVENGNLVFTIPANVANVPAFALPEPLSTALECASITTAAVPTWN